LDGELLKANDALFFARIVSRVYIIVVASTYRFGIEVATAAILLVISVDALGLLRGTSHANIVLIIIHPPLH
jgi:hypothetical protein